jgi:site-specific DNA-methyltransferase (adenine-specific)
VYLKKCKSKSVDLIYIDPPFNTGTKQKRALITVKKDDEGTRTGFKGQKYKVTKKVSAGYLDSYKNYIDFLKPRLEQAHRILKDDGALFFQIDYREAHYCKILLDSIFGRKNFRNEIIWAYDYGARSKNKWSAKHDTIFWYTKSKDFTFNYDDIDRVPYMAPNLVSPEKAAKGKTPTDVWWMTIVSPTGKEKTGYPTQKPIKILKRIVRVHSNPNDMVMDFFAGSGTTGEAALDLGRHCVLVDDSEEAIKVIKKRLKEFTVTYEEV